MNKGNFWIVIFSVLISFFSFHYFLNFYLKAYAIGEYELTQIHFFLFISTFIIVFSIALFHNFKPSHTGFLYLALMLLKMIVSVFFLWKWIILKTTASKIIIGHGFAMFLLYLLVEVLFILANNYLYSNQIVKK